MTAYVLPAFAGQVLRGLNARINPVSGAYAGSFIHPVTHAVSPIHGVLFQKQNAGFGFFVSASETGASSLTRRPPRYAGHARPTRSAAR